MKFGDIKRHLSTYSIYARRKTTINHAFASAVAPSDRYDERKIRAAIASLGQDPNADLFCVYCGGRAETWDHVFATVRRGEFSGAGHRLGNLLPCCKQCNSRKGNKDWDKYIETLRVSTHLKKKRKRIIKAYLRSNFVTDEVPSFMPEYSAFLELRSQILLLMQKADKIAAEIRRNLQISHRKGA